MEIYNSEEQQEEAIKRFLKENGLILIAGTVLGLGAIYGWNYYQADKLQQMADNSMSFSQLTASNDLPAKTAKFVEKHNDTQYGQLAQLMSVKSLVAANKLDQASELLRSVIASDVESSVKSIATIRLARIENSQQQYTQALTTLAALTDSAFDVQKNELIGDIEVAQGNLDKARIAYLAATDAAGEQVSNELEMKLNDLTPAV